MKFACYSLATHWRSGAGGIDHRRGGWNKFPIGLNVFALSFLSLERMIGDTILGNVILIALAVMSLALATLLGLIDLIERRTMQSVVTFLVSFALIGYIVVLLYSGSVAFGYGP